MCHNEIFKLPTPIFWVSSFLSVNGRENISIGHYEKIEKWLPFCKYASNSKFKLPTLPPLPKVWVSSFLSVNGIGISASAIMKKILNIATIV